MNQACFNRKPNIGEYLLLLLFANFACVLCEQATCNDEQQTSPFWMLSCFSRYLPLCSCYHVGQSTAAATTASKRASKHHTRWQASMFPLQFHRCQWLTVDCGVGWLLLLLLLLLAPLVVVQHQVWKNFFLRRLCSVCACCGMCGECMSHTGSKR